MRRALLPIALLPALAVPATASAAKPPGSLKHISAKPFTLKATGKKRNEALVKALPLRRAGVGRVLDDANRFSEPLGKPFALRGVANVIDGFQWKNSGAQGGDGNDPDWYPQGITGTADSTKGGTVAGRRALAVSWYAHPDGDRKGIGVRVSFVGFAPRQFPTYRHVLLVDPRRRRDGRPGFAPVNVHAGGIAWYGRYLYVADTDHGFRVFDTKLMRRVNSSDYRHVGLRPNGRYAAAGYRYILPQVFRYVQPKQRKPKRRELDFSYVSLDRAGKRPMLLSGEYREGEAGGRLVRWPLSKVSPRMLASKGRVRASRAYRMRTQTSVQGALRLGKRILLSSSRGKTTHGCLASPGTSRSPVNRRWALGAEDLYRDRTSGLVWSLSEYPGKRTVFGVPASKLTGKGKSNC